MNFVKGEIIVQIGTYADNAIGSMYEVYKDSSLYAYINSKGHNVDGRKVRQATVKEIESYMRGIRNINDIPKEKIVNSYEIY